MAKGSSHTSDCVFFKDLLQDLSQRDHKSYKWSCQFFGELLIKKKEQILLVISAIIGTFREGIRNSTSELALESRLSAILFLIGLELKISIGSFRAGQVLPAKSRLRLRLMNSGWDQKPFPDLSRTSVRVCLWYLMKRHNNNVRR